MPFYAVRVGRKPGIYTTWNECKAEVAGFPNARYKKFDTKDQAAEFVSELDGDVSSRISATSTASSSAKIPLIKKTASFKAKDATKRRSPLALKEISLPDTMKHRFITRQNLPTSAVVYTDGCCLSNGRSGAVGGVGVYWAPQHPRNVSEYLDVKKPTNQKAELRAASRALEIAIEMGLGSIELRTDSKYTIQSMTEWIKRWQSNGWKTAAGKTVENMEEMMRLAELCKKISITWVHVAGHEGIYGNEEADRLANEGAAKRNTFA